MSYSEDLARERIRPVVLPDFVIAELKLFHAELKPDKEKALLVAKDLDSYCVGVQRFIADTRRKKNSRDWEIQGWLAELASLCRIPAQIRDKLKALESVEWGDIQQTSFPDKVDQYRRGALVREYRESLKPGNVKGTCERIMGQVRDQLVMLDSNAPVRDPIVAAPSPPYEDSDKLIIINNLKRGH